MKIRNLIPALLVATTPVISLASCSQSRKITIAVNAQTKNYGYLIADAVAYTAGKKCTVVDGSTTSKATIILDDRNEEVKALEASLGTNEYQIQYQNGKILIAAHTGLARNCAIDHLLTEYLSSSGLNVPSNLDVIKECNPNDYITEIYSNIQSSVESNKYRDPFIYREGDTYYMVATSTKATSKFVGDDNWHLWKATKAFNDPYNVWKDLGYVITDTRYPIIKGDRWAPELYKYTNPDTNETAYYIFTTFATVEPKNEEDRGRGCAVFKSDTLVDDNGKAAEFQLISYYDDPADLGRITNHFQSCIDGHLFIDNGTPYMVFVEEFTDFNPKNGRMFVAKMSNDLTHFVEPAKELFKATDAPWVSQRTIEEGQFRVTDGPFIYKLSNGKLLMLWSSYFDAGSKQYCMGYATADSIFGPWTHHKRLIYDEFMLEGYKTQYPTEITDFSMQGGHGMIFTDTNDKMYMCIHCGAWDKKEHPFIFPIKEAYGTLVWDLYKK